MAENNDTFIIKICIKISFHSRQTDRHWDFDIQQHWLVGHWFPRRHLLVVSLQAIVSFVHFLVQQMNYRLDIRWHSLKLLLYYKLLLISACDIGNIMLVKVRKIFSMTYHLVNEQKHSFLLRLIHKLWRYNDSKHQCQQYLSNQIDGNEFVEFGHWCPRIHQGIHSHLHQLP